MFPWQRNCNRKARKYAPEYLMLQISSVACNCCFGDYTHLIHHTVEWFLDHLKHNICISNMLISPAAGACNAKKTLSREAALNLPSSFSSDLIGICGAPLPRVLSGCPQPGCHGNRRHMTKSQPNLGRGGELAPRRQSVPLLSLLKRYLGNKPGRDRKQGLA